VNAVEHFEWARNRAMEYIEFNDGGGALASLVSDLNKHPGTADILSADLLMLATGELLIGGARGLRGFIEGIPSPVVTP
jgi:hypothetical protein